MIPINLKTHYSFLESTIKAKELATHLKDKDVKCCGIVETNSLGGHIEFFEALKKKDILPILGMSLTITNKPATEKEDNQKYTIDLFAKNLQGWNKLIQILSRSNNKDVFLQGPRTDLNILEEYVSNDLVCVTGHYGTELYDFALKPETEKLLLRYKEIFGDNLFLGATKLGNKDHYDHAQQIRDWGREHKIKLLAYPEVRYLKEEEVDDYRVVQCIRRKVKFNQASKQSRVDFELSNVFDKNERFMQLEQDHFFNDEELDNQNEFVSLFQEYDVLSKPRLPHFTCPDSFSQVEYFRRLCREGWKEKLVNRGVLDTQQKSDLYRDRVLMELEVLERAELQGYFLIVQDFVNWARERNIFVGPGRGSAAGCLVSYLLGITLVDPIPHDLLFERFYSDARAGSLPDIDIDFPKFQRERVIEYIKEKYGPDKVAHICTYSTLKGKNALTEVLNSKEVLSFFEIKQLTDQMPDEQKNSDKIQDFFEENPEDKSLILWTLHNEPEIYQDYCTIDEKTGDFQGELASYFKQAIRLEGLLKNIGQHAAGVIISDQNLNEICPMIRTSLSDEKRTGFDMKSGESAGLCKFDFLNTLSLDRIQGVNDLLQFGEIKE